MIIEFCSAHDIHVSRHRFECSFNGNHAPIRFGNELQYAYLVTRNMAANTKFMFKRSLGTSLKQVTQRSYMLASLIAECSTF